MSTQSRLDRLLEARSLPEWITPYVAGLIDNHASLVASIARSSNHRLGYRAKQELRYKQPRQGVFDLLERYGEAHDVHPRITEQSGKTYQRFKLVVSSRADLAAFLRPLQPYLFAQQRAVALLTEVLIPGLDAGAQQDKESFLAWVHVLEAFQQATGRANRSKYDAAFFQDEWECLLKAEEVTPQRIAWLGGEWPTDALTADDASPQPDIVDNGDELPVWIEPYVAALVDCHWNLICAVSEDDARRVGYKIMHKLRYSITDQRVARVIEAYLEMLGITPDIHEQDDATYDRYEVVLSRREDICTLLEAVRPYCLVRQDAVTLLLDEIIPALNAGAQSTRKQFVDLMGTIETFRETAGRANRATYTQEYFITEWDLES